MVCVILVLDERSKQAATMVYDIDGPSRSFYREFAAAFRLSHLYKLLPTARPREFSFLTGAQLHRDDDKIFR
jgi:hypothetical protein